MFKNMEHIISSNFSDCNYYKSNINIFLLQNNISGDSSSLSNNENNSFNHEVEAINLKLDRINQSTDQSSGKSFNQLFLKNALNDINYNQFPFYNLFASSNKINNQLNININDEIKKKKIQPIFIIEKTIKKNNKNITKKSGRKYDEFNIKNNIQGYYSNNLIELNESVCKKIGREDLIFHAIKRKYKVDNIFIKKNKNNKINKTIEDFFINSSNYNQNLCKKIREEKIQELIDILS